MTKANSFPPNLGLDILMTMEIAVLRRLKPRTYEVCGLIPYFYTQLFPQDEEGNDCTEPWVYSPMLEYFLEEMEDFFENNN